MGGIQRVQDHYYQKYEYLCHPLSPFLISSLTWERIQKRCFLLVDSFDIYYGIFKFHGPISSYLCLYVCRTLSKKILNGFVL